MSLPWWLTTSWEWVWSPWGPQCRHSSKTPTYKIKLGGGGGSILAPPKNMISQYAPESRYTKNELKVTNIRRHEHFNMYPDLYWTRRLKRICIQHNNHNKSCKLSLYIFLITLKTYSTLDYNYQGIYNCQGNRITVPRVRYSRLKAMQCSVVRARFFFAYYWWF